MERTSITSGNLRALGYDERDSVLEVEFEGGDLYVYRGVPPEIASDLLEAPNAAQVFDDRVRDAFPFHRVGRD